MLRSVKSSGALRAAGSASFRSLQHRTLVSSVLLTKDAYDSRKVTDLKSELKQRGLPLNGKRDDLIKRLLQDDARRAGSGASAPGRNVAAEITSVAVRGKSTLASLRDGEKSQEPAKKANTAGATAGGSTSGGAASSSIPDPNASKDEKAESLANASAGDLVIDPTAVVSGRSGSTQRVGNAKLIADEVEPVKAPESNPPGIPPSELPNVPPTFNVNIPYEQPPVDLGPEIVSVRASSVHTSLRHTNLFSPLSHL
jgi:SAP domain